MNKWLARLKKQTARVVNELLEENDHLISLRQAGQTAANEEQLERLHDQLTAAWNKSEVGEDVAEDLTRLMWERSRQLSRTVHHTDERSANNALVEKLAIQAAMGHQHDSRVYFSEMLSIPIGNTNSCSYCGYSRWWTKSCGQRICDACHPNPWGEDYISNVV